MRARLLFTLCLFSLSGCVYYGDIHSHSTPLNADDLTAKTMQSPPKTPAGNAWWIIFQDAQLNQLISAALENSPDMKVAETRVKRAEAITEGAVAPLWPSIDFSGYAQRQRFSAFGLAPPPFNGRIFNIGELGFNANYEFDLWGKNRQLLAATVSEQCAAKADLAEARLVIAAAVANTYFQLQNAIAARDIAMANLQVNDEISKIVSYRASHGVESDIPLKSALANAQSTRLAVEQYKQAEALSRNRLAVLIGKNPFAFDITTQPFDYHSHAVSLPSPLVANLLANRPDINAAKQRVEAATHQVNVSKARFFPNIDLMGLFSYQSVQFNHLFEPGSQNNAITGAVDLPIFDAGARRANLRVNYADYDLAVNYYNQTLLNALREVADLAATLKTTQSQLQAQQAALMATEHKYDLFKSRYRHGIIDYVQLLEIKSILLEYRSTQLSLETQHLQSIVSLIKALGGTDRGSAS